MARGVSIERIWIFSAPPSRDEVELLSEHRRDGVRVFVVRADEGRLDSRLLVNLTLMDEGFLQQDLPNKEGKAVEYLYSENAADLDRARNTLAQLKSRAIVFDGSPSLTALFPEMDVADRGVASALRDDDELG
jgi:hypothetical protein